ncbi:MAG: hypothetical protein K9W44_01940 [Candidatus Lokiarchaeota archaeon]|nr:hypothetical protein [Candidatus Harpocratesius repetitus]
MDKNSSLLPSLKIVFLYNTISPLVLHYLKKKFHAFPNIELIVPKSLSLEDMIPLVETADVLIGWKCPLELLKRAKRLKLYITPYTGVSYLVETFKKLSPPPSFPIVNAHGAAILIAQHAVALLFGILNHLVIHHNKMLEGKWIPGGEGVEEQFPSIPIIGRKIGLFGYGQINQKVHKLLQGLPVEFHIMKRNWNFDQNDSFPTPIHSYIPKQLDLFMKSIDTLIIAAPLTPQTKNLIKMKHLRLLGKEGIIVNVGRAKIINERDLFHALKDRIISRAALDVWYIYNPKPDKFNRLWPYSYPFNTLKNVLLSPHRADSPFDDLRRWDDIIENIIKVASGKKDFINQINLERGY